MADRLKLSLEALFYILTGDKQVCVEDKDRTTMQDLFQSAFEKILDTGILSPAIRARLTEKVDPSLVQSIIKTNTMMIDRLEHQIMDLNIRIQECSRIVEQYESRIQELEFIRTPCGDILPLTLIIPPILPPGGALPWPFNKIFEKEYKAQAERRKAEIEQIKRLIEKPKNDIKRYQAELKEYEAEIEQCEVEIKRCKVILAE